MESNTTNGHYTIEETFDNKKKVTESIKEEVPMTSPKSLDMKNQKRPVLDESPPDLEKKENVFENKIRKETEKREQETEEKEKSFLNETIDKVKNFGQNLMNQSNERLTMEGILLSANKSLKQFLNPELSFEKQIPTVLLKRCKGIVFLTIVKGGLGLGGAVGTGCLITHNPTLQKWSNPIALGIGGLNIGFQIGASKISMIMVLTNDTALNSFSTNGQLKFGGDLNLTVGPKGRNADISLVANQKSLAPIYSYSMSQGAFVGVTFNGQWIFVRNDCNDNFYKTKTNLKQILSETIMMPMNSNFDNICKILNSYIKQEVHVDLNKKN